MRKIHANGEPCRIAGGEHVLLPPGWYRVRVRHGTIWVTQGGRDHVVTAPGSFSIHGRDAALVSGLRGAAAVLTVEPRGAVARFRAARSAPAAGESGAEHARWRGARRGLWWGGPIARAFRRGKPDRRVR